jgi:uncharacterized protein (DUF885 family)
MVRAIKWLGAGLLVLLLVAGALLAHTWVAKPLSINWFYTRTFLKLALDNPELLTNLRLLEQVGIRGHNAKLADISLRKQDQELARLKSEYAVLNSYNTSGYTGQDKLSVDILKHFMGMQVRSEPWRFHDHPVSSHFGMQSTLPSFMTQQHQVNDATDAQHYIARLQAFTARFDQLIANIKLREDKGIVPPKFSVDKVVTQLAEMAGMAPTQTPLYISLKENLEKMPADKLGADARTALLAQAEQAITQHVLPAYKKLLATFEALRSKATANNGVWALPQGDAFYQYTIENHTTTTMKADEIHQLGLSEVARIGKEMDAILRANGQAEGTIGMRVQALAKSPAQLYPNSDEGRAQILKDYQAMIDEITAGLAPYFATLPKAKVAVKRVEPFAENVSASAYYMPAPLDGSRPGTFYANLRDVNDTPKFGMRTLAYHEAVPGHHMQIAIAQELKGLPLFRSLVPFTAYAEGWALYAEQLAWEMGFQKDPLSNLGRLQAEMFRAVRLVVDTGIHAKRWTREQAITYMIDHTGMGQGEVETEIERYFLDPGQALAYKVGMIKMWALREKAKSTLGSKFDLREFHDVVLKNGAMPLTILEQVVDSYIAGKKG